MPLALRILAQSSDSSKKTENWVNSAPWGTYYNMTSTRRQKSKGKPYVLQTSLAIATRSMTTQPRSHHLAYKSLQSTATKYQVKVSQHRHLSHQSLENYCQAQLEHHHSPKLNALKWGPALHTLHLHAKRKGLIHHKLPQLLEAR